MADRNVGQGAATCPRHFKEVDAALAAREREKGQLTVIQSIMTRGSKSQRLKGGREWTNIDDHWSSA